MKDSNEERYIDIGKEYALEPQKIFLENGKTVHCYITFRLDYDECFDTSDFEEEDRKEIEEKLDSCDLVAVVITVKASFHQNEGTDCIGGCLLDSPTSIQSLLSEFVKPNSMEENAVEDLKESLNKLIKELSL